MTYKIYFAHPFKKKGTKMESKIIELLSNQGLDVIDPFKGEEDILRKYGITNYYDNPSKQLSREIYRRDYESVHSCDFLFAWLPTDVYTIGTPIEFSWAHDAMNMYTIVLCPIRHPFPMNMADFLYHTLEEMEKSIEYDVNFIKKEYR